MANALENPGAKPGAPKSKWLSEPVSVGLGRDDNFVSEEDRRTAEMHRAAQERHKQALNLQRENILSQKTSNPGRRAALEAALAQIETQIQALG